MSRTHRQCLARRLQQRTGWPYQRCLVLVEDAAARALLPTTWVGVDLAALAEQILTGGRPRPAGSPTLAVLLGHTAAGAAVTVDRAELRTHALILGATGSGRSLAVHHLVTALATPAEPVLLLDPLDLDHAHAAAYCDPVPAGVEVHRPDAVAAGAGAHAALGPGAAPALTCVAGTAARPALDAALEALSRRVRERPTRRARLVLEHAELLPAAAVRGVLERGRAAGVAVVVSATGPDAWAEEDWRPLAANAGLLRLLLRQGTAEAAAACAGLLPAGTVPAPGALRELAIGEALLVADGPQPRLDRLRLRRGPLPSAV